jgi:hypothetical protein
LGALAIPFYALLGLFALILIESREEAAASASSSTSTSSSPALDEAGLAEKALGSQAKS